jgi:hydrogenase expression/formation protein HypE
MEARATESEGRGLASAGESLILRSQMTGETIQLDHGAGGASSRELIADLIAPRLGAGAAEGMELSAVLELDVTRIAVSSDTFVVDPIFFGNGDIGRLAVCGTVNDLAVSGAVPRYLTLSLVLEQGLPIADLARVLDSVRETAVEADVEIVVGDARVVRRGEVDKLFIGATGVGELTQELDLGASRVRPGDAVIVTGELGNHAVHILSLREGLGSEQRVLSDCAPLDGLVWNVLEDYAPQLRCMRAVARGGLGGALNELAGGAGVSIELEEHRLPVARETRALAARLGVDPLYLPSEGSICMVVEGSATSEVLELIRWQPQGQSAQIVGTVRERGRGAVTMVRPDGGETLVELFAGVELPRLR